MTKTLFLTAALLATTAAAVAGRASHGRATTPGEGPGSGQGGPARATMEVRVQVVTANGVDFAPELASSSAEARLSRRRIVVEDNRAGELLIEVWKAPVGVSPAAARGELVAAAPVRLKQKASGRARGTLDPEVAGALEAAARQPGAYTVAVAY